LRIQIRRRGGLAGIALRADLDTSELDSETAARVEAAIARLWSATATVPTPQPDAFEYEITLPDHGAPVVVGEHELPSDLEPLIEKFSKVGQVEQPRRRPR
jgi:Emfourin